MSEVFWSVDSLVIKENTLFGFGWIFHARHEIMAIRFRLSFAGGDECLTEHISADAHKPRDDVKHAFENQPHALNSGYVVFGAYPPGAQISSIDLVCSLADGSILELPVPSSSVVQFGSANESESSRLMIRQFYVFFKRSAHLVRSGNFTSLFEKVTRYLKARPKSKLRKPADLAALLREGERKNLCLIVDHDLGGGANHYRERLVDSMIRDDRSIVIFTYHVATLSHVLILRNSRVNLRFSVPDKNFVLKAVKNLSVIEIIYNTAVSFAKPDEIPHLLIHIKKSTSPRLRVLVHDFFLACPSHFLIDDKGKYCHVPHVSVCSSCLPKNQQGFTSLVLDRDMPKWRSIWGGMLSIADEIVTFSHNSSTLLLKAYPHLEKARISVVPHKVTHVSGQLPKITNTDSLRIGVVGQIGFHKGSLFIQSLAREIGRHHADVKIVVIGTIEATSDPLVVTQTGPYRHDDLTGLIEKSGANVFLFPSIWPETFSYVVEEMMTMSLPVASFNLGAPAERLENYQKGLLLNSTDPATVLDDLISFHRKSYLAN
ncbi:MAG: glycosyltransferase [Burkholderiales bacterium]|nr:glycosyltransferase [Burkholderiales bacterium]